MSKELEALKSIKGTIISSRMGDWGFEYYYLSDIESTKKHFDIIEQALKRNEPKKLKTKRVKVSIDDYRTDDYCPTCDGELYTTSNYCPYCGQKLDWSDE